MTANPRPPGDILVRVLPQLVRFLHRGLRDYPLTLPQLRLLAALTDGEQTMGDVAAELGIRPPTLTGLVDPLHRQGLVTRRRNPVAWREVLLGLSPAGRDVYHTVLGSARQRLGQLITALSASDQESLVRVLTGLEEALRTADATAMGRRGGKEVFDQPALRLAIGEFRTRHRLR
jgi:DNA-binding MarR family transcriptional regulator